MTRYSPSPIPTPCELRSAPSRARRGLTLVELLITMAIIAIISAAVMGTAAAAIESARRSRTQTLITRIHYQLMEHLETYASRRLDINPNLVRAVNQQFGGVDPQQQRALGQAMADLRLLAVRELMKYEMPDRWSDVREAPVILAVRPALALLYARRFDEAFAIDADDTPTFQAAECLFLTVMHATGDGETRSLFSDQDIGDVDGDGAQEFIDGWGNPISYVRWPAGFVLRSRLMLGGVSAAAFDPLQLEHDPFDPFGRDQPGTRPLHSDFPSAQINLPAYIHRLRDNTPAFRLMPLIYSSGPDGISDINTVGGASSVELGTLALDPYSLANPAQPYALVNAAELQHTQNNFFRLGAPGDDPDDPDGEDNSVDNIHNHELEY